MKSHTLKTFFDYSIFSLSILLVFQIIFENYLVFPEVISWLGHWHPVVLHLPIVLVFVTIIQYWRKDPNVQWFITITAFVSLLTAHSGYILSAEGDSKGSVLTSHQWLGTGITFLLVLWHYLATRLSMLPQKVLQGSLVVLVVLTGHFGGMVTHGVDFLSIKVGDDEKDQVMLPDNPTIYAHIIQPILDHKCVACHNDNKAKGGLKLTNYAALDAGGESGSALDHENGILHRINLSPGSDGHMPPENEMQLEEDEMLLLHQWLESGGSESRLFSELESGSEMQQVIAAKIEESRNRKWSGLPSVTNEEISELSSDYCTIFRKFSASDALQVIVFPHKSYSGEEFSRLKRISENIVELNASNLPLTERDIKTIGSFENLETLILSGSSLTNNYLRELGNLTRLKTLNLYNTAVGDDATPLLSSMVGIENVYIYQTGFSQEGIDVLRSERPELTVISDSEQALTFESVLPVPTLNPMVHFFREPFYARIEHPLKGINIKYTLDGSEPNEGSQDVNDSILIDKNFTLHYYAEKDGWEPSAIDSVSFLRSDVVPLSYELTYPADQKYLGIGKELLFDLKKGSADFGDDAWMAFRQHPFELTCEFEEAVPVRQVTVSSMVRTRPHIFPPARITIYGGVEKEGLRQLFVLKPAIPSEQAGLQFKYYACPLDQTPVRFLRIRVEPLQRLPNWHPAKGEQAWFFVDEVVLTSDADF